jgi:Major Facilitator Superfamily/Cyclic nucleotide-binding domain
VRLTAQDAGESPLRAVVRNPVLGRVGVALGLYRLAEFGPWIAILVFAYGHGGATATGLVSLGLLVPTALAAPLGGPVIDRYGAGRVLVAGYAAQALAMGSTAVSMLAGAPPLVCYVLGAATATVLTVTHPAHAVMSPAIARTTEQLVALNAVTGWILSVGLVAAPALAGLILSVASPGAVYAAGALCLVAAATLVFPLRTLAPPAARSTGDASRLEAVRELGEATRAIVRGGPVTEVMLLLVATFVTVGAFDVLAVTLAVGVLDLGGSGAAYLTALYGLGAVLGTAASFWLAGRERIVPILLPTTCAGGAVFIVLGLAISLGPALAAALLGGVSRGLLEVCAVTLLQRVTPTALLARMLAFKEGLTMAAWGFGSILVPALIALGGNRAALIGIGAIAPLIVLTRLRRLLLVDAAATVPVVAIALLRSMRLFRPLPAYELEAVARAGTDLSVPAGTRVVTEGEYSDVYFAIADGVVEVTCDGRRLRTLSRGEGFGEIGLIRNVQRTATVTAMTDALLLSIERGPFITAVTGHPESLRQADAIIDELLPTVRLS